MRKGKRQTEQTESKQDNVILNPGKFVSPDF